MDNLLEIYYSHPIVSLLQSAFTIWMLVDVYRRGAEYFWFWVIFFLPGIGAWVYFFAVKVPAGDFGAVHLGGLIRGGPSLDRLRYQVELTPRMASHLALGERLVELGRHDEAAPHLEAALKTEPEHGRALFLLASCFRELGRPGEAVPLLERLVRHDQRWGDYAGWRLLVEVQGETGDAAGAMQTCRELVRLSPTLQNRCLLADHLLDQGDAKEARLLLEQALRDHAYAPGPIRRRNRRWAREAQRLSKQAKATE